MLFLEREIDCDLLIGDDVLIRVTAVRPGKRPGSSPVVVLGVAAPSEVAVDRHEVRMARNSGFPAAARNFPRRESPAEEVARLERRIAELKSRRGVGSVS